MMIAHHTKSTAEVTATARQAKLRPMPPKLTLRQAEMIAQLRAETDRTRDAPYIAQQKGSHNQKLTMHKACASEGSSPPLRRPATGIVQVVEQHIEMLKQM